MAKKKEEATDAIETNPDTPAFVFIGDPNNGGHGPDVIEVRGYTFERGKPTAVDDERAAAMFANHTHFKAA